MKRKHEVCIRTANGQVKCGPTVRTNPKKASRGTVLAAMQYRQHPHMLRELREGSEEDQSYDEARTKMESMMGYGEREASLRYLAQYVRTQFQAAEPALFSVAEVDPYMALWCLIYILREHAERVKRDGRYRDTRDVEERTEALLNTLDQWLRGQNNKDELMAGVKKLAGSLEGTPVPAADETIFLAKSAAANDVRERINSHVRSVLRAVIEEGVLIRYNRANYKEPWSITEPRLAKLENEELVRTIADAIPQFPVTPRSLTQPSAVRQNPDVAPIILYHGGRQWEGPPQIQAPRAKRAEYGPGIYLTTRYETAAKYAKGGGHVRRVYVDPNVRWLGNVRVSLADVLAFVRSVPRMRNRDAVVSDLQRYAQRIGSDVIPLVVLVNLTVNHDALVGAPGVAIASYLVSRGADADVNTMGDEDYVVIFNPDKILRHERVSLSDVTNEVRDLPLVRSRTRSS